MRIRRPPVDTFLVALARVVAIAAVLPARGSAVLDIVGQLLLPFVVGQLLRRWVAGWVSRHWR